MTFSNRMVLKSSLIAHWFHSVYNTHTHTHTHTQTFKGPFSRTTRVSRYQKGKKNLDFTEARDSEWQLHQLGHMQVCTLLQTDNYTSTPPLSFYRPDALPAAQPTASKHWRSTTPSMVYYHPGIRINFTKLVHCITFLDQNALNTITTKMTTSLIALYPRTLIHSLTRYPCGYYPVYI